MRKKTFLVMAIATAAVSLFFFASDLIGAEGSGTIALTGQVSANGEGPLATINLSSGPSNEAPPQTDEQERSLGGEASLLVCAAAEAAAPKPGLHAEVDTFVHILTVQARLEEISRSRRGLAKSPNLIDRGLESRLRIGESRGDRMTARPAPPHPR